VLRATRRNGPRREPVGDRNDGISTLPVAAGAGNVGCPNITGVFADRSASSDGVVLRATQERQMSLPSAIGAFSEAFSFGPIPLAAASGVRRRA
jgi:hypothetical protein